MKNGIWIKCLPRTHPPTPHALHLTRYLQSIEQVNQNQNRQLRTDTQRAMSFETNIHLILKNTVASIRFKTYKVAAWPASVVVHFQIDRKQYKTRKKKYFSKWSNVNLISTIYKLQAHSVPKMCHAMIRQNFAQITSNSVVVIKISDGIMEYELLLW